MTVRPSTTPGRPAGVLAALIAVAALTAVGIAAPAAAVVLPAPPAQGVKMQEEPGQPSYGTATAVNDVASHPPLEWYGGGAGSDNSVQSYVNYVIRTAPGRYTVWLPGIDPDGAAVIAAAGGTGSGPDFAAAPGSYCVVAGIVAADWDVPGTHVEVTCFGPAGTGSGDDVITSGGAGQVDATFVLTYSYLGRPGPGLPTAYLRATRPTAPSYVPDPAHQFNVTGRWNTVERVGVGDYLIRLPGIDPRAGRARATGYGAGGDRCEVRDQASHAIGVSCLDAQGRPADAPFILAHVPDSA